MVFIILSIYVGLKFKFEIKLCSYAIQEDEASHIINQESIYSIFLKLFKEINLYNVLWCYKASKDVCQCDL